MTVVAQVLRWGSYTLHPMQDKYILWSHGTPRGEQLHRRKGRPIPQWDI